MNETITRYHYILNFDHNGSPKAREAWDRAQTRITQALEEELENIDDIKSYAFDFEMTETDPF